MAGLSSAQALLRRGKGNVAVYIKSECMRSCDQQLNEILNIILNPENAINDFETLDWCRHLIAGDMTFDEFAKTVRKYDNAVTCGLVWTTDFVAYRCRTCGISPCMSLCADCFQAGDHTGHDFNMFRSQAGGACDCGDITVMRECGFCPRHGPSDAKMEVGIPPDLLTVAEVMMPRLLFRLVQHMRDHCTPDMLDTFVLAMQDADDYVGYLHSLSDMGAAMREVVAKALINPQIYRELTHYRDEATLYQSKSQTNYSAAITSLTCPPTPDGFKGIVKLDSPLVHLSLLEELMFWIVKFEFPQKTVTLLLSLLPSDVYKEAFAQAFLKHYSRMSIALVNSGERQRISNREVHISVQLLSPEVLATHMVEKYHLLYIMLGSLKHMMAQVLTTSGLADGHKTNNHMVVDCAQDVLKVHCYWPIVSDLINILPHRPIAYKFMADEKLLNFWFELVSYFQGMNLNQRELNQHVEYEPDTYYAAFSAELEICSSAMWSMLAHCHDQNQSCYTRNVLKCVTAALQKWFDVIGMSPHSLSNPYQVSFHLPLHRYLAMFLGHTVKQQRVWLPDVIPCQSLLQLLVVHPLQIQVSFYEIAAGLWVRNGLQIRGQAMTYVQYHFCNSMVDADLFLLQVCASRLDPDYFAKTVLERFHVMDVLSLVPTRARYHRGLLNVDHEMPMLEGMLTFLLMLLANRTQLGMTDQEVTSKEMITLLCMADRTHSQLIEMMPEKCGLTGQVKDIEPTLRQVADYKAPNFESGGTMLQGTYVPKGNIWESDYDPLYVLLRVMYRRDFQASMDRYTEYVRKQGLYKGSGSPWPPFRVPPPVSHNFAGLTRLLHCRTMHGMLFCLLYKSVYHNMTDAVMYLTLFLLELALCLPPPATHTNIEIEVPSVPKDKLSQHWFRSSDILVNLRRVIPFVEVKVPVSSGGCDSASQTDQSNIPSSSPSFSPTLTGTGALGPASGSTTTSLLSMIDAPEGAPPEIVEAVQALLQQATNQMLPDPPPQPPLSRSQGVSANLDTEMETQTKPVNESMLSLLMKLHAKLAVGQLSQSSYIPEAHRADGEGTKSDLKVGDGPFFVGKVLDKICRQSAECQCLVDSIYKDSLEKTAVSPLDSSTGRKKGKKHEMLDKEEKRRRARERQHKLIAQFASKQKEFMEKVIADTTECETDQKMSEINVSNNTMYDCVICSQKTASTEERPFGLITLLQSTSVLGHRRHSRVTHSLSLGRPTDTAMPPGKSCRDESRQQLTSLLNHFDDAACYMAVNMGWEGGIHAQTCGHYLHLDCQKSYLQSLQSQQQQQNLDVLKGEYCCPLCRQLSNTVLPIPPDTGPTPVEPLPTNNELAVKRLAEMMSTGPPLSWSTTLEKAMSDAMDSIMKAAYSCYKIRPPPSEAALLFVCSALRTNLELDLLQRDGIPYNDVVYDVASKKSCIVPLLHVLSLHSKLLTRKPSCVTWAQITGVPCLEESSSVVVFKKEVPILMQDSIAVLTQLLLSLPFDIQPEVFHKVVQAVYNLMYTQALTVVSCKFSVEERRAWSEPQARGGASEQLCWLMSKIISELETPGIYFEFPEKEAIQICGSVWSPQTVEITAQQWCLPFLRLVAMLQHYWFDAALPSSSDVMQQGEFQALCSFLALEPNTRSPIAEAGATGAGKFSVPLNVFGGAECVQWLCSNPGAMVENWCRTLGQFAFTEPQKAKTLLCRDMSYCTPQLITLPPMYDSIFQHYRKQPCKTCTSVPKDAVICLLCTRLLCFKERCCKQQGVYECVQHSIECGGGTGMFLLVNSSVIVVIRGPRAIIWGSVYLDAHGEEDQELKRGKTLYLSEDRYRLLHQQWVTHSFDRMGKRWVFHSNRL